MKLNWWNQHKGSLAVIAVIVAFFVCFFGPTIFSGRVFLAGDQLVYTWPLRTVAWEMIRHGQLPLWTPYVFSGYPLLSMAQLGIGYPLTWGYLFLPGHWAESIYIFAPYLLSPIFTYVYLRKVGRSQLASLLGGLSFSYGGLMLSGIGLNGMLPNAMMWTPLLLIAIERSRENSFAKCVLLATGAYAMSVLTGIGQGFVYAGALAIGYALFVVFCWPNSDSPKPGWKSFARWKPLAAIIAGMLLAAGVAAFQILESRQAQRLSVRARISYDQFSEGAFRVSMAWKSWLDPFHIFGDVTAYVSPLVVLLAIIAVVIAWRKLEPRVWFWLLVAVIGWVLMVGPATPLFKLVFQLPVINHFRVPSRHAFEWTLAASVLAAYGWDAVGVWLNGKQRILKSSLITNANAIVWLAVSLAIGAVWYRATAAMMPVPDTNLELLNFGYLGWKLAFLIVTALALWAIWQLGNATLRNAMLTLTIAAVCFVEPFCYLMRHATAYSTPINRLSHFSPTTKAAQQSPPEQHRAYFQFSMDADHNSPQPRLDPPNISAVAGLHSVSGFEPLMLERYSRALNSSNWDTVNRAPWLYADQSLFQPRSHVLDLLNTTRVISYSDFVYSPGPAMKKDGIEFPVNAEFIELPFNFPIMLHAKNVAADTLAIVSNLSRSKHIADGTPVVSVTIHTVEGRIIEDILRAGTDTAEWAHERPDVKATIKHGLPPIFDRRPGDAANSFPSLRYLKRISFNQQIHVKRVEITNLLEDADVGIWHATLFHSATQTSTQLRPIDAIIWEPVYTKDEVLVARNNRALPRAWLATEAEALDGTEIWRRIRGLPDPKTKTITPYDPRRTALLELEPSKLPKLNGGELPTDAYARIVHYEPNRLTIETNADRQTILVVSEIHYPGWVALLNGAKTPIHQTNFLLRGIVVPAGKHTVEMSYRAPQARNGAIISLLTIGLIGWIGFRSRRR
ncbi:MAG: YfhO family protein [Acidobacteriota bacterium]|nr:YfhO family protein [Acidobacteriota bacterium]